MTKKILVLLGHADTDTFSGALADRYERGAEEAGHDVVRVNIGDLEFDPVLHKGYKEIQPLEPDLVQLQQQIEWADHVVIVYPNWWCTMPAILKGLFDRIWLPGFAFNFDEERKRVIQHLKGKTGRVVIVAGSHSPFMTWWNFGDYTNEIQHGILGFAGIKAAVTPFGPCDKVSDDLKNRWLENVERLGRQGK